MANRKRSDVDTETALAVIEEERNLERIRQEQQVERERLIAKSYEMAGQIKAVKMLSKFGDITSLMWLKQIKESKIYRDLPEIGTWEDYCKYLGLDRHTVDQDLLNLGTFGEDFLVTVTSLQVSYRDLRKLRQLTHDGTITIDADAIRIGEECIPLDADHREDLQAAIEQVIEEQAKVKEELDAQKKAFDRVQTDTRKTVTKLEKELTRFEKQARAKNISPEEDAIQGKIEALSVELNGHCLSVENVFDALRENPFPNAVAAFINLMDNVRMRTSTFRESVVANLAPVGMLPDEEWTPPPLRTTAPSGPREPESADCIHCRSACPETCAGECCATCRRRCKGQQYCRLEDPINDGLVRP